jgi:hypothetical protein
MGLMQHDDLAKATDLGSVLGESEPSGRALNTVELQKVFDACHRDTSPAGIRDGAIIGRGRVPGGLRHWADGARPIPLAGFELIMYGRF